MNIRPATDDDLNTIWTILEPMLRGGETYALPIDWNKSDALAYWFSLGHSVFVAEIEGTVVGTYFLRANQKGGGDHVANCGYVTSPYATGKGVARMMCNDSLRRASNLGFKAMQFNYVVSSNDRAVSLWKSLGFDVAGTLPNAFQHPKLGLVDVYVMYRWLQCSE